MRRNPNDGGIAFNPERCCAPDHNGKRAPATSRKRMNNQVNSNSFVFRTNRDLCRDLCDQEASQRIRQKGRSITSQKSKSLVSLSSLLPHRLSHSIASSHPFEMSRKRSHDTDPVGPPMRCTLRARTSRRHYGSQSENDTHDRNAAFLPTQTCQISIPDEGQTACRHHAVMRAADIVALDPGPCFSE